MTKILLGKKNKHPIQKHDAFLFPKKAWLSLFIPFFFFLKGKVGKGT